MHQLQTKCAIRTTIRISLTFYVRNTFLWARTNLVIVDLGHGEVEGLLEQLDLLVDEPVGGLLVHEVLFALLLHVLDHVPK